MSYELIPIEDRQKYRCCVCGETRSVKYFIETINPLEGDGLHKLAYCNRCALLHAELANHKKRKDD